MPKAKPKKTAPKPSSEATLTLSSLHTYRETLETEHQRLLKQIKRKRTELNNFVEQLRSIATQIFHKTGPIVQKMMAVDEEIHKIFAEIFQDKKLNKKNREKINDIYLSLQIMGVIHDPDSEEEEDEDQELDELFEDEEPTSEQQNLGGEEAPKNQQPRHIRQTFIKLAEIFHPDKVGDVETQMQHTEIMKEINRAYHENDLARLLEIEKQYLEGENIDNINEDDLTRRCRLLEQQNEVLKNQYDNLREELSMVKRTPEGSMVSDFRRAVKAKVDPIEMVVKSAERELQMMEDIRNFVRDFRDKKITLQQFLKGPDILQEDREESLEEFLEEMLGVPIEVVRF
jgi:hypothetical protein